MGEVVGIRGSYKGRFWQFNEDEADALLYLPHIDQVLYLMGLRRHMDFSTGLVGVRRKVSYQMFKELLEVHRARGSNKPDYYPKRDELRASIKRLESKGLVEKMASSGAAIAESMVFKLPLAHVSNGFSSNEGQHQHSTGTHTRNNSDLTGVEDYTNPTQEKGMNPTPQHINKSIVKEYTENSEELSGSDSNNFNNQKTEKPKAVDQDVGGLKVCPHQSILQIWSEVFPNKKQPRRDLWAKQKAAGHLRSMWREAANLPHSSGTRMMYSSREDGLLWWRAFFEDLAKSNFLMSNESQFFDLAWLVKRDNFFKSLDGKYRNKRNGNA